ncbi:MAG: hypothetical protein AABY22_10055 [Nanoarchaeota archaeon]
MKKEIKNRIEKRLKEELGLIGIVLTPHFNSIKSFFFAEIEKAEKRGKMEMIEKIKKMKISKRALNYFKPNQEPLEYYNQAIDDILSTLRQELTDEEK